MPRNKEPVDLILAKGKSHHLTKSEIKKRKNEEIKAPSDKIKPPSYLNKSQKKKFKEIAIQLIELDIMSNLDCDALARYLIALDMYIAISNKLQRTSIDNIDINNYEDMAEQISKLDNLSKIQDRYFKQCRMAASDLGLTITSRCRLVIPKAPEPKKNKFDKFGGIG